MPENVPRQMDTTHLMVQGSRMSVQTQPQIPQQQHIQIQYPQFGMQFPQQFGQIQQPFGMPGQANMVLYPTGTAMYGNPNYPSQIPMPSTSYPSGVMQGRSESTDMKSADYFGNYPGNSDIENSQQQNREFLPSGFRQPQNHLQQPDENLIRQQQRE